MNWRLDNGIEFHEPPRKQGKKATAKGPKRKPAPKVPEQSPEMQPDYTDWL